MAVAERGSPDLLPWHCQREKQQISVPFCWEEKPGRPRRDWGSNVAPARAVPPPAAAAIPFKWERKPGTPLADCAPAVLEPSAVPVRPSPGRNDEGRSIKPFASDEEEEEEGSEQVPPEVDAPPSDAAGESGSDEPHPSENSSSGECETWGHSSSTSETNGETDSGGSGAQKSAEDVSVLEFLFPLSSPEVSFLNELWGREEHDKGKAASRGGPATKTRENRRDLVAKRAPTLGELILLSRKLSCRRQDAISKRRLRSRLVYWQKLIAEKVHACGLFGTSTSQSITRGASSVKR